MSSIERVEHSIHVPPIKTMRLNRIAHNAGRLQAGSFVEKKSGKSAEVDCGFDGSRVVVTKPYNRIAYTRTTVNVSASDYDFPYISASRIYVVYGDTVTTEEYAAHRTNAENDLGLFEVASIVRVAGRICVEENRIPDTE